MMHGLINRKNYQKTRDFLEYRRRVLQNDHNTVRGYRLSMNYLLEWAGETPFVDAMKIEMTYPEYLTRPGARKDGKEGRLSPAHIDKITSHARLFFEWLKRSRPSKYRRLSINWVESIRPPKASMTEGLKKIEYWTLEDVRKVAEFEIPKGGLRTENGTRYTLARAMRAKAGIVFLYLTGMRATAFITLPASCVDIEARRVEQLPSKGVQTKNTKAAITTFLNLPDLIDSIRPWDEKVRAEAPGGLWYAMLDTGGRIKGGNGSAAGRRSIFAETMHAICDHVGVEYKSPHKLRHGHAIYGVKNADDIEQLKAVSQNLMHANLSITDGIYGQLTHENVADAMKKLGQGKNDGGGGSAGQGVDLGAGAGELLKALQILTENPGLLDAILDGNG